MMQLNSIPSNQKKSFVFLVCSERSGSNLITSLLNRHQDISAPPPSHLFRLFCTNSSLYTNLTSDENWEALVKDFIDAFDSMLGIWNISISNEELLNIKNHRSILTLLSYIYIKEAESDLAKSIFIKENHSYLFYKDILETWPSTKFLIQTRNPLDMAASWVNSPSLPGGVEKAVDTWLKDQQQALAMLNHLMPSGKAIHIKYEDLISSSNKTISKACDLMGLTQVDMENTSIDKRTLLNSQRISAWENIGKPIIQKNFNNYSDTLNKHECEYILLKCAELMTDFGYYVPPNIMEKISKDRNKKTDTLRKNFQTPKKHLKLRTHEVKIRKKRLEVINRILSRKKQHETYE